MPKISGDLSTLRTPNAYEFSGVDPEDVEASEFTLVTVVNDLSISTEAYKPEMVKCLKTILEACADSPRCENLMLRLVNFHDEVIEVHGFRPLSSIDAAEYDTALDGARGYTALYDGLHTSTDATLSYARDLTEQGICVNAIVFTITDGFDNRSKFTPGEIAKVVTQAKKNEALESIVSVLIGITDGDDDLNAELERLKVEAGLDQYINIGSAEAKILARLAAFISKSIVSQSQSLGTGGGSDSLTF